MLRSRILGLGGLVALNALGGCTLPQIGPREAAIPAVSLYGPAGNSTVAIRLVDNRPRRVQAYADADAFNGVLFRLSNANKLKSDILLAMASSSTNIYTATFSVPNDSVSEYFLTAGLYNGVSSATNPLDPAYSNPLRKVGEGASSGFALPAGSTGATVSLTVNAVGKVGLNSLRFFPNGATVPTFEYGDSTLFATTSVNATNDASTSFLTATVYNSAGSTIISPSSTLSATNWATAGTNASISFNTAGSLGVGTYQLLLQTLDASLSVLSSSTRSFAVELPINLNSVTLY